jgi:hypothetical protein
VGQTKDWEQVFFAPRYTRVYSAAPDPEHPGVEAVPSDGVRGVMDFWTNHYRAIEKADAQYHLQNQFHKWSQVTELLVMRGVLPELAQVSARRDYQFDTWNRSLGASRVPQDVQLIERSRWIGSSPDWECMELLASERDDEAAGIRRTIFGGVTLATAKDGVFLPKGLQGAELRHPHVVSVASPASESKAWRHWAGDPALFPEKTQQQTSLTTHVAKDGNEVEAAYQGSDGKGKLVTFELSEAKVQLATTAVTDYQRIRQTTAVAEQKVKVANQKALEARPSPKLLLDKALEPEPPDLSDVPMAADWRESFNSLVGDPSSQSTPPASPPNSPLDPSPPAGPPPTGPPSASPPFIDRR